MLKRADKVQGDPKQVRVHKNPSELRHAYRSHTATRTAVRIATHIATMKITIFAALFGSAAAFVPSAMLKRSTHLGMSKYDGQTWDFDAMLDVYNMWDPNMPRSEDNFNPFEKNKDGNQADPNGYYPGDGKYKDPIRPDTNFEQVMKEQAALKDIRANPKPGDVPGAPGRLA